MISKKTVTWTTRDGRKVEVKIEVSRELTDSVAYADGWNVNLGKEIVKVDNCVAYVGDKKVYSGKPTLVTALPAAARKQLEAIGAVAVMGQLALTQEHCTEIMAAIAEATAEAESDMEAGDDTPADTKAVEALETTPVPAKALAAYRQYKGSAESAWEASDEQAWASIRRWRPFIEAQYGADPEEIKKMATEAAREAAYGVRD